MTGYANLLTFDANPTNRKFYSEVSADMSETAVATIDRNTLVTEFGGIVHSIVRKMIWDAETARDAAQEVWCEILRSLPSFQGKSELSTWIYTITTRVVMKYVVHERQYSQRFIGGDVIEKGIEPDMDKRLWVREHCGKCLRAFLHCLDTEARLAIIFRDLADLSYGEIASVLEKDEAAVRQLISRSRHKVKSFLEDDCALYNLHGNCRCRIKQQVLEVAQEPNLPEEYEKIRQLLTEIRVCQAIDTLLPPKNFWENLL